jgi:hypothetical protein
MDHLVGDFRADFLSDLSPDFVQFPSRRLAVGHL